MIPRRVLLVTADAGVPVAGNAGSSAHQRGLASAFQQLGHWPLLAAPRWADPRGYGEAPPCRSATAEPLEWPRGARGLGRLVDRARLQLACGTGWPLVWERLASADAGLRRCGDYQVLQVDSPPEGLGPPSRALARRLAAADRVQVVSPRLADWARRHAQLPAASVVWAPNGTALAPPLAPAWPPPDAKRLVLGWLGHLRPWHDQRLLLGLLDALPEAELQVCGEGAWPRHPRLKVLGPLTGAALPAWLQTLHVGLSADRHHLAPWRCPLKVVDYRSQGVPVLATSWEGLEALRGPGCQQVSSEDPRTWAEAARAALTQPRAVAWRPWTSVLRETLPPGWLPP